VKNVWLDNKKVIEIIDGKIKNFEELLKDIEWFHFPIDEACVCGSHRIGNCQLLEKDAVWGVDSSHNFNEETKKWHENTDRHYRKYYGSVRLFQKAHCRSRRHRISILPLPKTIFSEVISCKDIIKDLETAPFPTPLLTYVPLLTYINKLNLDYGYNPHSGTRITDFNSALF